MHDGVVTLLEQRPSLLLEVWRRCGGPADVQGFTVTVLANELRTSFGGQGVRHMRPDLVVRFDSPVGPPRHACIEVVATADARRIPSWLVSAVLIRQRFRDPDPIQILIPLGREVRQWLERQIRHNPGISESSLLTPSTTPISDLHASLLELALLRSDASLEACERAIRRLRQLDDPFTDDYESLILHAVSPPQMEMLRMSLRDLRVEIDDADRQGYFYSVAFEEGERAGLEQGETRGEARGRQEMVASVIAVLEARQIASTPELLTRLHACTLAQLRRAIVLALDARSPEQLERAVSEVL